MERRRFLQGIVATGVGGTAALAQQGATPGVTPVTGSQALKLPQTTSPGELRGEMLYRPLGRTGETVSAIGLGGSHIAKAQLTEAETTRLIHEAIDRGLTFMDNSWDYNEGRSERRMGNALSESGYRNKAFLMTKIDGRDKETARNQLEDSLTRLKTDHIDLLQFHEVLRFDDPDRIFADGGALETVQAAKQAGKIRFIGFTGHKDPHVHLYMLETAAKHGFHFDTAQMPLNVMDAHFRSFAQLVVPHLVEQQIGVLGMKPFCGGDGIALKSGAVEALDCLHYALSLPTSVVITGIDKQEILDQAFQAAKTFKPFTEEQLTAVLTRTEQVALSGKFELFKTSAHFDTTAKHADWLGGDTPAVQKLAPQSAG